MIFSKTVCGAVVFVLLHPCLTLLCYQFAPQIKQLGCSIDAAKLNMQKRNRHATDVAESANWNVARQQSLIVAIRKVTGDIYTSQSWVSNYL